MQFVFNGLGTTLYGKRDIRNDGSHITTEWFVIFYVPIIPLQSMRINHIDGDKFFLAYSSSSYKIVEYLSLCVPQILHTYLYLFSLLTLGFLVFSADKAVLKLLFATMFFAFLFIPTFIRKKSIKRGEWHEQ
jgi:hypothetical protein